GNTIYKLDTRITGINELKTTNALISNYPNPFTDKTTITYILQRPCRNVVIEIYNAQGQKVSTKNLGFKNVGQNNYVFNEDLPAGVYYYSITTSDIKMCKKMIIIK
ncbi:MAG TPA: T9SS type A sorting domain-containing protein, partial [Bacteroidia bacterium]|nr:T9SS type A sorting domain-containing protein [Bacteroidia bacterium]